MRTSDGVAGNSWFICTLWLAEYYIARAKTTDDLEPALEIMRMDGRPRALPSGVLAEQIDPVTGERDFCLAADMVAFDICAPRSSTSYSAHKNASRASEAVSVEPRLLKS